MTGDAGQYFEERLESLDRAVSSAVRVSRAAAGRHVDDPRQWWASVLFARLCTSAVSLLCLTPESRFCGTRISHYDSSATATLARNIVECYVMFFYLCIDDVGEEEWRARLNVMYLYDCVSRLTMFRDFNPEDPQLADFEVQAQELRARLMGIPYFAALPDKRRKVLLRGETAMVVSRNDVLARLDIDLRPFRALYRFLSSHVHSSPLAFSRMGYSNRGRGVESEVEKSYIAIALEVAEDSLGRATADILNLFPDIPSRLKES